MTYLPSFLSTVAQSLGWSYGNSGPSSSSSSPSSVSSTQSGAAGSTSNSPNVELHAYEPSPLDVLVAKVMLQQGLKLPAEVVLSILDFAEYWPHTSATLDSSFITLSGRDTENRFVLRTKPLGFVKGIQKDEHDYTFTRVSPKPLPEDAEYPLSQFQSWIGGPTDTIQHPCRKIVFTITSHDQGWSHNARHDRGSYRGSCTWFEAGLERFDQTAESSEAHDEKDAVAVPEAENACNKKASTPATKEEASGDTGAPSSDPNPNEGDSDPPDPRLCASALRPIYPVIEADADPPALHFDLLASPQYTIQYNKTATRPPTTHTIIWSWKDNVDPLAAQQLKDIGRGEETGTGEFVRNLKLGDVVTVWAKSRFGGWANFVDAVTVDVYWAL